MRLKDCKNKIALIFLRDVFEGRLLRARAESALSDIVKKGYNKKADKHVLKCLGIEKVANAMGLDKSALELTHFASEVLKRCSKSFKDFGFTSDIEMMRKFKEEVFRMESDFIPNRDATTFNIDEWFSIWYTKIYMKQIA